MASATTYEGSCHCGALRFGLRCEPITAGIRCNCSICIRRGMVMSVRYFPREELDFLEGLEGLAVYRFGDREVNHYFCKTCGIYPFHDLTTRPGHYRLNLGCIHGFDPLAVDITPIDGRSF
jgi:hypothetical protein